MKKIILSFCVFGLLTGTAYAACNGGTMRGGFCVSNVPMNWWSAQAWCQANGSSLATIYDACPGWDGNTGIGKCGHVIDSSWINAAWTSTAKGTNLAYHVDLNNGGVYHTLRDDGRGGYNQNSRYALCK